MHTSTHTVLYDPDGLIEAGLPLDREPYECLGRVFRILPGSRAPARASAALSSVANAPQWLPPPPCIRTHQTPLPDPA